MGYKSGAILALAFFCLGFFTGRGKKQVQIIHEKGKTHEKVVYRDVVKNKVVHSIRTIQKQNETFVEQNTEYFFSASNFKNVESHLEFENKTKIEKPTSGTFGVGIFSPFTSTPSIDNTKIIVLIPTTDYLSILVTSNLKFNTFETGLMIEF